MRILYIDIDSLRPDHLGCYGYHRNTSPNIAALTKEAVRFENVYVSDAPCLPSRTALWSGRSGFHTGVVGHGGTAAQPFFGGASRGFNDLFGETGWLSALRRAGYRPVTVSSFADRHSAWHWYAGYLEVYNPGKHGYERAHEVNTLALDWLRRRGREDDWFLHVNYTVPEGWDGRSLAHVFKGGEKEGRPYLVTSQGAWACQRGVRFDDYLCLRSYHDGYALLPPLMLFDAKRDPHERHDLADQRPDLIDRAMGLLADWQHEMMLKSPTNVDPLMTVVREGGPYQVRGKLSAYLERLKATGRAHLAEALAARWQSGFGI